MSQGKLHSLASLFHDVGTVEIPIVQRDYAQGRPEEHQVRDAFLNVLREALCSGDDVTARLNLDFVYGSFESASNTFAVLDGQQRLTTLFLLHWYCAIQDGRVDDFRQRFADDEHARFRYATRSSATEFFDALVRQTCVLPAGGKGLGAVIKDSHWFFLSWEFDPTVQACLGMLDAIHAKFHGDVGLYERLTVGNRITFEFLNLLDFGLSDDLYIKMNARGKPLTPFENFKAWLVGRHSADQASAMEFDRKMDQEWLEVFWQMSRTTGAAKGPSADELFMWFFYLIALYEACSHVRGTAGQDFLERLNKRQPISHAEFASHGSFDETTLARVAAVLDYLAGAPAPDDLALCQRALLKNDLMDVAGFNAVICAIEAASRGGIAPADGEQRQRWNRVSFNLINNARIDDVSTLQLAVRGTTALAQHFDQLYEALAQRDLSLVGFTWEQLEEEKLKARLILSDADWVPVLRAAETHEYFQGKVGFALEISRTDSGHDRASFQKYAHRAGALLARPLRESEDLLLERALLAHYDYLPAWSFSRYSFCLPGARSFRDRSENWLRVIREPAFKTFLDALGDGDPREALERMIAASSCADWRKHVIADPELIRYCGSRFLKRRDGRLYLISKLKASSRHVELHTYALYQALRRLERTEHNLTGLMVVDYVQVTEGEPFLLLAFEPCLSLRIKHLDGRLRCFHEEVEVMAPPSLTDLLASYAPIGASPQAAES